MNSKESQTTGVVTVTKTNAAVPSTSETIAALEKAVGEINYTPIEWINGGVHPLSAENIQRFEDSFTALIGNASVTPGAGIIDKITATLREEIEDRATDIKTIHTRLSNSEANIQEAVETESKARSQEDAKLDARINKFKTATAPAALRSEEDKLQVIKRITVDTTPTNEEEPYVKIETGDIDLKEVDIPTLHTDKINLNDNSRTLTKKLEELDAADNTQNGRIDKFTLAEVTFNGADPNKNNKLQVITSIAINPEADRAYVTVKKDSIALSEVDIPDISTNKVYVDTDTETTLTSKLRDLVDSDTALGARISSLTTTKVSVNDPTTSESGYCEVISSFEIADDTVTVETAPISLTNKDIPANISSDKIDVAENQTLTAELAKLNQSDIDIKAYIDAQLQEVTKGTMYWKTY